MRETRVFSFGGGVQSHAVLVMQALKMLPVPYDSFLFCNVGADSENPATLEYIERFTLPFCEHHAIPFLTLQKTRFNAPDTLLGAIMRDNRSIPIPAYTGSGAPGNRSCTQDFKIAVVDRHLRSLKFERAVIGLGISLDEIHRARDTEWYDKYGNRPYGFWKKREYPLIEARLNRTDCLKLIEQADLPVPPKSSCFFCPFHSHGQWQELKNRQPDLFERSISIERAINDKRAKLGKDALYLHYKRIPLDKVVGDQIDFIDDLNMHCETGYCLT